MYDLIVLGGGPAGYHGAQRAATAGLSTLLIEKSNLGGVCLNEGCIPSKTLLYSSKLFSQAKNSQAFGVSAQGVSFDLAKVMARKQKVVEMHRQGIAAMLKKGKVIVENNSGFLLPKTDAFNVKAGEKIFQAKRLLLCTGSEAIRIPVPGADSPLVVTNKEILSTPSIPGNLVVIGAGVVGLELASFFAEIGSSVTIIELLPFIAGSLDKEIGQILRRELEKKNIKFLLHTRVKEISDNRVICDCDGKSQTLSADLVLMSAGRKPIVKDFGLENLGVEIRDYAILTDPKGRTNISNVWAAGDVNGRSMLAHTAYREAEVCIDDMMGKDSSINYDVIAGVIYTHPEVAVVGFIQEEAEKRGFEALSHKLPMSYNGRYTTENEAGRGICKIVVDRKTRTILGVHMIGGSCSEMIFGAAMMVERKMTMSDMDTIVFPHPTISEIIKDTLGTA
jgi:dihydrolipoamide dehydrogenase